MIINSPHGTLEVPTEAYQIICAHAERVASYTVMAIEKLNLANQENLSMALLLELGALMQLHFWEAQGLFADQRAGLPSFRDAEADLLQRMQNAPEQFDNPKAASLSLRVLRAQLESIAWDRFPGSQHACVLSQVDDESFIEAMAQFLWKHRHMLTKSKERSTNG